MSTLDSRLGERASESFDQATIWIDRNLKWILIGPAMAVLLGLMVYPLVRALELSFYTFLPTGRVWAGTDNFEELFTNTQFHNSLWVTAKFTFFAVSAEMLLGFGIALLLNKKLKFRGLMQTLFLVPIVISPTVVALLWQLLYSQNGVIDFIVIPILGHRIEWLSNPDIALWAIILPDIWQWTPMVVLVMLAGLQAVPDHMQEAAIMDGASRHQRFIDITLPYLKNLIVLLLILRIIGAIRVFAKVFVLTRGGPGGATNVVSMELYRQAFRFTSFGKASAMALVLMGFVLAIALLFSRVADIEF